MRIIGGSAKKRKLQTPKGSSIRPTTDWVREALFNILGPTIEGARVLDLFAGTGSVGLEAISRGASFVTLVEKNPYALNLLRSNLETCGFNEKSHMAAKEAIRFIQHMAKFPPAQTYDFIFADPPYNSHLADKLLAEIAPSCLSPSGLLIIEHPTSNHPAHQDTAWEKKREAVYGKTTLSFYRQVAGNNKNN